MRVVAVLLFLVLTASGCLSFGGDDRPDLEALSTEVEQRALGVLVQDHDHHNARLHADSMNVRRVGYSNGFDNSGDADAIPAGVFYTEFAVNDRYAFVARASHSNNLAAGPVPCLEVPDVQDNPRTGGFVVINVQDNPSRPTVVGEYDALAGADVEVDSAGQRVFFATQRNCPGEVGGVLQESQSGDAALARGIHVVDVSDPTSPVRVGFEPLPYNGPHTITYFQDGGREFVSAQTYDLVVGPEGEIITSIPATQQVLVYQVVEAGDSVDLVQVARFQVTQSGGDRLYIPHDAIPQRHPLDGGWYLYVAYWDKGVQVVDLSSLPDPGAPGPEQNIQLQAVGQWTEFAPSSQNAIHQVRAFDHLIDGRHVTVAEPEIITADETGVITFLDTSDVRRIQRAGPQSHWRLPGDLVVGTAGAFDFSPHNFDLWDGKVALAHNHGGVWIIDVGSRADLERPKSVGYFLDVEPRADPPTLQPWFWGVLEHGGRLYAVDESSGLYVLEYTGP